MRAATRCRAELRPARSRGREETVLRLQCGLVGVVALALMLGSQPALAFSGVPAAPGSSTHGPAIASVGSRVDRPLAPTVSPHGPPSALPWRALDEAGHARAKADAARRAADLASYRRDDFSIRADPASQTVAPGGSTTYTVSTQSTTGTAQTMTLSVSGLPAGATGTFNPPSILAGNTSTLAVATATATPAGSYTLTITGAYKSPPTSHSTMVTLVVTAPPVADDFSIAATPSAQTVAQGVSTTYTVSTAVTAGSAQSVSLSVGGVPSGATGTFDPPAVTAGGSSQLSIATTASAAIGANSYIELINVRYGIYARDGSLINDGDLGALTLFPVNELSDPQIVWDPTSQRFYYLAVDFYNSAYAFGYSKTANPQSSTDFCHYYVGAFYSSLYLPDYPKMAVTQDFVLVGTNVFVLAAFYNGSDVDWFQKPTDPACPGQLGTGGIFSNLKNADGTQTSTPEPAVSADASSGGWVVGSADVTTGSASYLTLFKVTKNSSGYATISAPTRIGVGTYQMPANAPQKGVPQLLDTMDTRLTHAVAGYDPRLGATAVWTSHAVTGGSGGNVCRWGDYAGAVPDPLTASGGRVWLSGEWNNPPTDGSTPTWQTWNWAATP